MSATAIAVPAKLEEIFGSTLAKPLIAPAAIAINPVSSAVLGPESLGQIKIPVMMVEGSNDFVTPMVQEQLHPFIWIANAKKYLVTMNPGGHDSANQTEVNQQASYSSALRRYQTKFHRTLGA